MILFTTPAERWGDHGRYIGPVANRWALVIERLEHGVSLGVDRQYQSITDLRWHSGASYAHARVSWPWTWGEKHVYYDGPHCTRSLGFLHFDWSWGWCDKCYEER